MPFFLVFYIFSCFSKARKVVKRTSEVKFSYTEQAFLYDVYAMEGTSGS